MDVRMKSELPGIPGVQNAEEADLRTECVLDHVRSPEAFPHYCLKQEIVDDLLILQGEWRQLAEAV